MKDEKAIFTEAIAIANAVERRAFLNRACGDDAELRAHVQSLIDAHERAGTFLEVPPAGLQNAQTHSAVDLAGTTIGHYKLLERIGEGGMGVVYMAEQMRPVKRRVALKIIKPGLDTKQVIARFEAERQALAMMDHPNIAKVFDAGTTETGHPYFVMELVRGIPITDYCDQHQLTPRQRLELFIPVCQAVQHAHQKGIIHRDLKPNNVLVTLGDNDKPVPKVIDFGIAKATGDQRLTDRTLFTEFCQLIGTPLYMSPEQAEMSQFTDVDTRSDVYSLGVLLYELLTGTTPFDKQRLAKAAYEEVRRIIREEDPPRPSTRLSTLGETIATISSQRQTDPKKLSQTIRGELDWIVMKALDKERSRRYETAIGLAHDVERYLADDRVEACPPSRTYRMKKFIRRHRVAVFAGSAIAASLLIGFVCAAIGLVKAHRQERLTRIEYGVAMRNLAMVSNADEKGNSDDARRMARTALAIHRELLPEDDCQVSLSLHVLAMTLMKSNPEEAISAERECIANLRKLPDREARWNLPYSVDILANLLMRKGESAEATALFLEALPMWRERVGNDHVYVANTLDRLAALAAKAGKPQDEVRYLDQCLQIRDRVQGPNHSASIKTRDMLVDLLKQQGRDSEAEAIRRQGAPATSSITSTRPTRSQPR